MAFKFERRFCQICNLSPWLQATKVVQMHINLAIPPGNAWLKHWWDSGSCGTSSGTLYTKNLHKQQTYRSHLRSLFLTPVHHEFASWHTCTQSHSFVMYFSNVEASSSKELWLNVGVDFFLVSNVYNLKGTPMKPPNRLQVMLQALGLEHLPAVADSR